MPKLNPAARFLLVFLLILGTSYAMGPQMTLFGSALPAGNDLPSETPAPEEPPTDPATGQPETPTTPDPVPVSPAETETPTETPSAPAETPSTPGRSDTETPTRGTIPAEKYLVLGYYTHDYAGDDGSHASLTANSRLIDIVSPFQYRINGQGQLTGTDVDKLDAWVAKTKKPVLVLVHNYQGSGFSSGTAQTLLRSKTNRTAAVNNLYKLVRDSGFAGVHIDLENIPAAERSNYTTFIRELKAKFGPAGYLVTLAAPAKTSDRGGGNWGGAFDYSALGEIADQITLMTYDEHWFGGEAGPIASVGWVESVVKYALKCIPKHKIFLGIPSYGYDWGENGKNKAVSAAKAVKQAANYGAEILWDEDAQAPYYRYWVGSTGHTVYFENEQSLKPKLDLVREYGLAGISIWKLGTEDPDIWPVIESKLEK